MKAVILAAGEGRRCRPLTQNRSKVMLPVGNRPFMEHVILALAANDVRDLVVVVGYQKERVMDHFGDGLNYGVDITYVTQDEQLGTADALARAESHIDDTFLVLNGDNLVDERTIGDILSSEGVNVILAVLREHTGDYGVLTVERKKVTRIVEKPGHPCAGILNTGVYKFSTEIFENISRTPISERGSYELTQTLAHMIEEGGEIRSEMTGGVWADAIFAWNLLDANSQALRLKEAEILGNLEDGSKCRGSVEIGEGSIVRAGSYIIGPVSIGRNCDIGPNVTILPSTAIGDSVRIGSHSEIRNSIVMSGTRIGSASVITDSVFGASTTFGDNLITETGSSGVEIEQEFYRAEFGSVVADDVIAGSRVFMHPCTIVGTGSRIGSGAVLHGWIERGSRVI